MGEILALIVGAVLELIWQIVLQIVFELLLGIVWEILVRIHREGEEGNTTAIIVFSVISIALGAGAAWLSLEMFPHLFIKGSAARLLNLAVTPLIAAGVVVLGIQRYFTGRLKNLGYGYAWLFAVTVAAVRLGWGQ